MILSSRCGRGLLARMENSFALTLRQRIRNFLRGLLKMLCRFRNGVTLDQNIFAAEFILRIAPFRRISVRLNTVMKIENLGGIAQRCVDLLFRPDIECAFGRLRVAGSASAATTGLSASSAEKKPPSFDVMSRAT